MAWHCCMKPEPAFSSGLSFKTGEASPQYPAFPSTRTTSKAQNTERLSSLVLRGKLNREGRNCSWASSLTCLNSRRRQLAKLDPIRSQRPHQVSVEKLLFQLITSSCHSHFLSPTPKSCRIYCRCSKLAGNNARSQGASRLSTPSSG